MDMSIAATSNAPAVQQPAGAQSSASVATQSSAPPSAGDSVEISAAATQASSTAPTDTTTANQSAAASPSWSDPAVTSALATLNDTSGTTSVADQISAYQMLSGMTADASNFDPNNANNANAVDVATAFATSAFTQHVQSLMATNNSYTAQANSGMQLSEAWQRQLNAFTNLSSDDQQTLVAGINENEQLTSTKPNVFTVQSWQDYSQARVDVDRAAEAATPTTDPSAVTALNALLHPTSKLSNTDFVTQAKSYIDQYGAVEATADQVAADNSAGPPPATNKTVSADQIRSQYQAIATVSDTSGKSSLADQLSAYYQLAGSFGDQTNVATHAGVVSAWLNASFSQHVQAVGQQYELMSSAVRGGSEVSAVQGQISAFKSFSQDDQTILASGFQIKGYDSTPAGYLSYLTDGLKNASQGDAINTASAQGNQTLYQSLIANLFDYTVKSSFAASPKQATSGTQLNQTA